MALLSMSIFSHRASENAQVSEDSTPLKCFLHAEASVCPSKQTVPGRQGSTPDTQNKRIQKKRLHQEKNSCRHKKRCPKLTQVELELLLLVVVPELDLLVERGTEQVAAVGRELHVRHRRVRLHHERAQTFACAHQRRSFNALSTLGLICSAPLAPLAPPMQLLIAA